MLSQPTSTQDGENSYTYSYDKGGNILSKTINGVTTLYSYEDDGWGDLLTAYDGDSITYDTVSNPLTYRGVMVFTWTGRELTGATVNGQNISYAYNADGMRTKKTIGSTVTYYIVDGNKIISQKTGTASMYFDYSADGNPFHMSYNGSFYYFVLNGQGDVIALLDSSGNTVVEYTYDPWGKVLSVTGTLAGTLGQANPIRYRGYYYDSETGFYYVSSRYYDPEVGRWINADSLLNQESVLGNNMFAYCLNNPINMSDLTGNWPEWIKEIVGVAKQAVKALEQFAKSFVKNDYYFSNTTPNRRPNTGKPGSTYTAPNGDKRTYGPDGKPTRDWDHDDHGAPNKHPHDSNGGHTHDWENGIRGPAHIEQIKPIVGVAVVALCSVGMAFVVANDTTLVGIIDDFLIGPLGAGIGEGTIMIFGQ